VLLLGSAEHARCGFAFGCLEVDLAFSCDDEVGSLDGLVEVDGV
jgi:hypothetical protein